ncbi:hypothetical protein ACHHYP_15550 [Achlya hypogyna]|uniref:Uncharacterized protein n=1 Tax=Achlya hypogyna TaxID=1202772 RepID=A0A1V9YAM5_ACHHY|nr:hypothetical protein ACHHYP_15550 [Achlya hypogyna]
MWRRTTLVAAPRRWLSTTALSNADALVALIKEANGDDDDARDFLRAAPVVDLTVTDAFGSTALTLAARGGHLELCRDLLHVIDAPSSIGPREVVLNQANMFGSTPLMCASASGHSAIVGVLLAAGADVNIKTRYGSTALSKAAEAGHGVIVDQLLAHGASVTENALGKTPFDLALAKGHVLPQLEQRLSAAKADEAAVEPTVEIARVTSWRSATLIECRLEASDEVVLVQKEATQRTPINATLELSLTDDRWYIVSAPVAKRPAKQRCLHPRRPFDKKCVDCPERR